MSASSIKILVGGVLLCVVVGFTVVSSVASPYDPNQQVLTERLRPPSTFGGDMRHLLGTDQLGRDVLSRLLAGGRVSLLIGAFAVLASTALGATLGLTGAYYGGRLDVLLTMVAEIQLSLPSILIIIAFLALIGPSILTVGLILALSEWVIFARTVRSRALVERRRDYVLAAKTLGADDRRVIVSHVWPNVLPTLMVLATVQLGTLILIESALSYLGLGVQRPNASWGRMVADGQAYLASAWWLSTLPSLTIAVVVVGVNLLGDGLRQRWKME